MPLSPGSPAVPFHLPSTMGDVSTEQLRRRPALISFFSLAFTPV